MRFDIVTLFPELFGPLLTQGITRRAYESGAVQVRLWPWRDFAQDNYRRVDDRPYGGGPGMVMLAQPLLRALDAVALERSSGAVDFERSSGAVDLERSSGAVDLERQSASAAPVPVVHFTPSGQPLTQALVQSFACGPGAVLICGRYEGVDQRVLDQRVTHQISLGDFVLSGGEIAAMALLDAVARLQEGVLTESSHQQESFSQALTGLLEGPHYSRPEHLELDGQTLPVPAVLLGGNHQAIARWRREQALAATAKARPDLIAQARQEGRLSAADEAHLRALLSAS